MELVDRKKRFYKRVLFNITEEDHQEIKRRAEERSLSISDWVRLAIIERIKIEDQYQ